SRVPFLPGTLLVYEALVFGAAMTVVVALGWWDRQDRRGFRKLLPQALFQSYNIWALALAMIFLYYVDRDGAFRMFASHLLLGVLVVFVAGTRQLCWLPIAMIAVNAVFVMPCRHFVTDANRGRFAHVQEVRDFARAVK